MRITPNITRAISITQCKIADCYYLSSLDSEQQLMLLFRIFDGLGESKRTISKDSTCADLYFNLFYYDTETILNSPTKAPIVKLLIEILETSGCAVEEIYVDSSLEYPRLAVTITAVSQQPQFRDYFPRIVGYGGLAIVCAMLLFYLFGHPELGVLLAAGIVFFILIGCLTVFDGHNWMS